MRKSFIQNPDCAYFISSRCINREWFVLPIDVVWEIAELQLFFLAHAFGFEIYGFILMGNHYHLLVIAPRGNLSEGMAYFQREFAREISRRANRINRTFCDRFHRTKIESFHHFQIAYKYLFRNSVKANLCEKVEQYPYSSLKGVLGLQKILIPMAYDDLLFDDVEGTLKWLNMAPNEQNWEDTRKALRRSVFTLANKNKTLNPLEKILL